MRKKTWKMMLLAALLFCGCREVNTIEETKSEESSTMYEPEEIETTEKEPEETLPVETEPITTEPEETEPMKTEPQSSAVSIPDEQETTAPVASTPGDVAPPRIENFMTAEEIHAYNRALKGNAGTHLMDLGAYPASISGETVKSMIGAYGIPGYPLINGAPITEDYKAALLARRNLEGIPGTVTTEYAIAAVPAPVRSFPTEDRIGNGGFDYFQESMFLVGECVAVLHRTSDGGWSFVQGENYNGWVRSDYLGLTDRNTWLTWWNRTLTGDECGVAIANTSLNGIPVRMGTVLPIAADTGDTFVLAFPVRDGNGKFQQGSCSVPKNQGSFSKGYLPYNIENVMAQVQKMVGTPYGWGDTNGNPDCSSTVQAIYRCFGFRLARNTSWQAVMNGAERVLEGRYREETISILKTKQPGTLLFMNGHVMMYVGMQNGVPMIFHNVTTYSPDGIAQVGTMGAAITPLDICKLDGTSYYNVLHTLLDLSAQ